MKSLIDDLVITSDIIVDKSVKGCVNQFESIEKQYIK